MDAGWTRSRGAGSTGDVTCSPTATSIRLPVADGYENLPHARSEAHQISLLPARMRTAIASHP